MMKQTFAQMNQQNLTWDVGYLIVFLYNLWKSDNKLSKHNIQHLNWRCISLIVEYYGVYRDISATVIMLRNTSRFIILVLVERNHNANPNPNSSH